MSRYRKVETHLKQLEEFQSIITSMKTLSQLELRKLAKFSPSQSGMAEVLAHIATDFLTSFPRPSLEEDTPLWLVIGSERGFCGGFNEQLAKRLFDEWPTCREDPQRVLAVGRKLCWRLDEMLPGYHGITGACISEEIPSLLSRIVDVTKSELTRYNSSTLQVLYHSDERQKITCRQLLPPEKGAFDETNSFPPRLNLDPEMFLSHFLQHYLFLGLTQLITVSFLAENRYRGQHLGAAVQKLDDTISALKSQARSLRQEEITEEIEMILLGSSTRDLLS